MTTFIRNPGMADACLCDECSLFDLDGFAQPEPTDPPQSCRVWTPFYSRHCVRCGDPC